MKISKFFSICVIIYKLTAETLFTFGKENTMKISMWMLADWLREYNPHLEIQNGKNEIDSVKLFTNNMAPSSDTVYVGKMKDFFQNGDDKVLCTHKNDLIILPTDDLEEILNQILEAFSFYRNWDSSMLAALSSNCLIDDLVRLSERILREPFFILDSGQRLFGKSSLYQNDEVDEQWQQLSEKGSADIPYLIRLNQSYPTIHSRKEVYRFTNEIFPHSCYCKNFFLKEQWIGICNLLEFHGPLSQGLVDIFSQFCSYIQQWFISNSQQQSHLLLDTMLREMLSGESKNIDDIIYRFEVMNWKKETPKCFFLLRCSSADYNIHTHLCQTLSQNFDALYAFTYHNSICILCNLEHQNIRQWSYKLSPWLSRSHYYGCCSTIFTEIALLPDCFHQTEIIFKNCAREPGHIYHYHDFSLSYGFSVMQNSVHADVIHPVVDQLQSYDAKHHTEFGKTLYAYLANERHPSVTAEALQIHRSTLVYRLKRLDELLEYDLNDFDTRIHILISYRFLQRKVVS